MWQSVGFYASERLWMPHNRLISVTSVARNATDTKQQSIGVRGISSTCVGINTQLSMLYVSTYKFIYSMYILIYRLYTSMYYML